MMNIFRSCLGVLSFGLLLAAADRSAGGDEAGGTVKGQVVYDTMGGTIPIPAPKQINIDKDQQHCLEKGPILSEELVVNKENSGVLNAFVWLAPMKAGEKLPVHATLQAIKDKQVVIDQPCCKFEPHALGIREGQELVAKNSSPIAHNINWTGFKNPGGNVLIPSKQEYVIKDLVADRLPLKVACNIHGWMNGYVRIFDHPYFAVTDKNGKFEMKLAPAGQYRLIIWHENSGWATDKNGTAINIPAGGVADQGQIKIK